MACSCDSCLLVHPRFTPPFPRLHSPPLRMHAQRFDLCFTSSSAQRLILDLPKRMNNLSVQSVTLGGHSDESGSRGV